jgi:hypothetical protein
MNRSNGVGGLMLTLLAAVALIAAGCNKEDGKGGQAKNKDGHTERKDGTDKKGHEGWWCEDHGVPEHLCSLCMKEDEVKKQFKEKGDWCKLHDRAKSQCFKCDPALYAKYEAMYEAKFGKKPARPPHSEFQK